VQTRNRAIADVRREFDKQKAAFEALRMNPADPEANLSVGRYLCFLKNNWDTGLPMLAKGSDAFLKELAAKELANPTDPTAQLRLADGWWDQIAKQSSAAHSILEDHAGGWYQKALPSLSDADRVRAESRMPKDMASTIKPAVAIAPTSSGKTSGPARVNDAIAAVKAEVHLVRTYVGPEPDKTRKFHISELYLTPNGRNIVQIGPGPSTTAWERASGRQVFHGSDEAAISPDGRYLASSDYKRSWVVDLASPERGLTLSARFFGREKAAFSPDDGRLAISDAALDIWDLSKGQKLQHKDRKGDHLRYSPDGLHLLCFTDSIGPTIGVSLFDARTLTPLWYIPQENPHFASFSRDGTRIVLGEYNKPVKVLDAASGKIVAQWSAARGSEVEPVFSPDGHYVLTFWHGATVNPTGEPIKVYTTETGMELERLTISIPPAFSADWSPDGKRILVGCDDGAMRLIDFETGKVLQIFGGHTGAVRAVAFSFDGKFVASCCEDNKVRLFNIVAP
jgi:hypothetical protein